MFSRVFFSRTRSLGQLSLASFRGRLIEYQLRLGYGRECHLCRVAGNTVIPCGMWVPVAVWQPCELLYTCYLLTYLLTALVDAVMKSVFWVSILGPQHNATRICCWAPAPAAIDRYVLPAGHLAANSLVAVAAVDRWDRQTDGQTDGRTDA